MLKEIRFTVRMVPKAKGRPRFNRAGFTYTPRPTEIAERAFITQALQHKPKEPLQEEAHINIKFFMPIPKSERKWISEYPKSCKPWHTKRPDIDNLGKLVLDALNKGFLRDDSIIYELCMSKEYSDDPRIEVLIVGE
jgi:Holliday junction resolvase RusA-like endonuclease